MEGGKYFERKILIYRRREDGIPWIGIIPLRLADASMEFMGNEINEGRHRRPHFASYVAPKFVALIEIGAIGPPHPSIDDWHNSSIDQGACPLGIHHRRWTIIIRRMGPRRRRSHVIMRNAHNFFEVEKR
ncbi:hypothetical protein Tco_1040912 [Tanacetum coccineum]|uniref:Uncharacterized protein n=1 Tax=Tanacetum coccineum TaxID=301880 RepID=A0ABQ5GGV9_9ASTR